jgi:pimeloyl-ACP methyl ester carboxylesterase
MKLFLRLINRLFFLLLVLALLAWGGMLAWFSSWRAEKQVQLDSTSIVAKTSAGDIEYAQAGEGIPVLVFHGAPGGYDQAMLLGSSLLDHGLQVIAPSRPGFLRTPLSTGLTPEAQADAMKTLLDETLDLESVIVVGFSVGAPAAISFASRSPERTRALILISPVMKSLVADSKNPMLPEVVNEQVNGDMSAWYLVETAERDPAKALGWTFDIAQTGGDAAKANWVNSVAASSSQVAWFQDLAGTLAPLSNRVSGLRNDLLQMRALPASDFAKIVMPTLIVHGTDDRFIPIADVEAAAARLPKAELIRVPDTGHIVELGPNAKDVREKVAAFLQPFTAGPSTP